MTQVRTKIFFSSSKKPLPFEVEHVSISEAFDRHHTFEITASLGIDKHLTHQEVEQILGEFIDIEITTAIAPEVPKKKKESAEQSDQQAKEKKVPVKKHAFRGITDSLALFQQSDQRMIRIEGYSPCILMDSAPGFRVFSEQSTKSIAQNILSTYRDAVFSKTNFKVTGNTAFSVQTQETDYQYLCRLADRHQMNFFYDGQQFHFAPLQAVNSNTVELTNDKDLFHFRAAVNLSPIQFKVNGYNLLNGKVEKSTYKIADKGNPLINSAIQKSKEYPEATIHVNYGIESETELKTVAEELATRQTNSLVTISGGSAAPDIKIGSILDIKGGQHALPGFDQQEKFTVTHVTHSISNHGSSYSNSFSAIPDDNKCPVNMPGAQSKISGPLMAEVVANNDEKNLGRVKVVFLMDHTKAPSPWLRVLTPFTSKGGHFFIPEVGEKVVVFFEDFNTEKSPFVIGSFYDSSLKASDWSDKENRKKGICTGHIKMLFDENNGCLTFNAKSIVMKTEEGISFEGGKEIKQEADNIKLDAKQKTEVAGEQGVKVSGGRIDLN